MSAMGSDLFIFTIYNTMDRERFNEKKNVRLEKHAINTENVVYFVRFNIVAEKI